MPCRTSPRRMACCSERKICFRLKPAIGIRRNSRTARTAPKTARSLATDSERLARKRKGRNVGNSCLSNGNILTGYVSYLWQSHLDCGIAAFAATEKGFRSIVDGGDCKDEGSRNGSFFSVAESHALPEEIPHRGFQTTRLGQVDHCSSVLRSQLLRWILLFPYPACLFLIAIAFFFRW